MSCANEEANPLVSREYHLLRRLIDIDDNFIEVRELGEDLAINVRCIIVKNEITNVVYIIIIYVLLFRDILKILFYFFESKLGNQKMDEYSSP